MPYPRSPPNSFHRTHSKFVCASPPTEFTEFTEVSGGEYPPTDCTDAHGFLGCVLPPNLCTSVQSVGVFVGGYGIPAIPTLPSEFLPQNPLQVCLRKSSHRIHRIHRSFWRRRASHGIHRCTQKLLAEKSLPQMRTDAHRWLGCVGFSHGIHGIHRNFWRRIFSHGFHRCAQMVRLRRLLWEDSLVAAWVWQDAIPS